MARNKSNPGAPLPSNARRLALATPTKGLHPLSFASPYERAERGERGERAGREGEREDGGRDGGREAASAGEGGARGDEAEGRSARPGRQRWEAVVASALLALLQAVAVALGWALRYACEALWSALVSLALALAARLQARGRIDPSRIDPRQPLGLRVRLLLLVVWERTSSVPGIALLSLLLCLYGYVKFARYGY